MPQPNASLASVHRRRVFYIPGFDPAPPRRYRELYRTEARAQAAISGYAIDIAARHDKGAFGWSVSSTMDGHDVQTVFEVLAWSDIVRASMGAGVISTYAQLVRTAWIYISTGALFRLMRLRKGPVIAALYPIVGLLLELGVAGLMAWLTSRLSAYGLDRIVSAPDTMASQGAWVGPLKAVSLAAGGLAGLWVLRWFKTHDSRIFAYYLMHDYAFTAQLRGAYPPTLEARLSLFRTVIGDALRGDCDEVLVVGHSSGAHLAVSVLADLLRDGTTGGTLGFLSLGQVVPMVSFLPDAYRLRNDLQFLSTQTGLAWVDMTAPGDGCAFALCDPVAVSGVATAEKRWPLVLSAAFTQTLSPQRWKSLRWRFFRLHFQYLCAFDRPGEYDYFRITAGPKTLAARFAGRLPSRNRIETQTSGYTSRAA